ncbi:hypothetical protein BC937DRAFT_90747 [Endogone sp. FLAS-F59071]|nr:hypothetical protein BC937DRAFT_90747 [Endogone sp. FLAS-F59071]|eukprot:RUS16834.1 hypothetical protein BC937DRAFT_90747 [Endogone sp. FLAS-F59071]
MKIKELLKNRTFRQYHQYISLGLATYTLVTDAIFLSALVGREQPCPTFQNKPLINAAVPWLQETNIARWDVTNATLPTLFNFSGLNTPAYVLSDFSIQRGSYMTDFWMDGFGLAEGFQAYAGVIGNATLSDGTNTSLPLVSLVATAGIGPSNSTSYFFIHEGDIDPTSVCGDVVDRCFAEKPISFPFTSISSNLNNNGTGDVWSANNDNATYSIRPNLQVYVCGYYDDVARSYNWARQFGIAVGIFIITLELLKVVMILVAPLFLVIFRQPSLVNFSNNSPFWIFVLIRFSRSRAVLHAAMDLEEANDLQLIGDTFLHSLPMLVMAIQSISYQFNILHEPPTTITMLSCVGSCGMLLFSFFRVYVAVKVAIPKQLEAFKEEMSNYFDAHPQQERWKLLVLIFILIDCAINIFPLAFMLSLSLQGFDSVFVFIIPFLFACIKLLLCFSVFWTPRFRKPLTAPFMFSFVLNSPALLLCAISSPVRQLAIIAATSGVTAWASWPFDFVIFDLPILATLIQMRVFGYGTDQDIALLRQSGITITLAIIYLVWRIISGLWYTWISLSSRVKSSSATLGEKCDPSSLQSSASVGTTKTLQDTVFTRSTEKFPFFYALKRGSPTYGIFIYSLYKLLIWVAGLRAVLSIFLMPETLPQNLATIPVVSPRIVMVLGLVIFLCFDIFGSLALLVSYYGPFSTQTIGLYLNTPFLALFYTLLGSDFRAQIIGAAKYPHYLLLWKQRDLVLICSLLFIWPGFGFGYAPYGYNGSYSWWSWYGWGFDASVQDVMDDVEWNWSFAGLLGSILGVIYCISSILLNTTPIDQL